MLSRDGLALSIWTQLSRFYLKLETESSLGNAVFCNVNRMVLLDKDRVMDNVKNVIFVLRYGRMIMNDELGGM
jgi:hypothetical protein